MIPDETQRRIANAIEWLVIWCWMSSLAAFGWGTALTFHLIHKLTEIKEAIER